MSTLTRVIILTIAILHLAQSRESWQQHPMSVGGGRYIVPAYDSATDQIWLMLNQNLYYFDVETGNMTYDGTSFISSFSLTLIRAMGQTYVQDSMENLWIIDAYVSNSNAIYGGSYLLKFDLSARSITYPLANGTAPMQQVCTGSCLAHVKNTDGEYLIITGGSCNTMDIVQLYDIATDEITLLPSMNEARESHACVVHPENNYLYAIGPSNTIEKLDCSNFTAVGLTATWSLLSDVLPRSVTRQRAVAFGSKIFAFGGWIYHLRPWTEIYVIDVANNDAVSKDIFDPAYDTMNAGVILVHNTVYIFGGFYESQTIFDYQYQDMTESLDPTSSPTKQPTQMPSTSNPTFSPTSAVPTLSPTKSPTKFMCAVNEIKVFDGIWECNECSDGKQPNEEQSACVWCKDDFIGVGGYCDVDCSENNKVTNELHIDCDEEMKKESWYATAEFDAVIAIIGTLSGCSCVAAFLWAYCKKKCCFANDTATNTGY